MHRDKYVYEFIVIMSSLIPGTEGEEHRGGTAGRRRGGWPPRVAKFGEGGTAGTGGRSWVILLGILASRRSNLRIAPVR